MKKLVGRLVVLGVMFVCVSAVRAGQMVTIGYAGNAPDTRFSSPGYGRVDYTYQISAFEVTAGEYTEFLNAVAATDTYNLYRPFMADPVNYAGCGIVRTGTPGSYSYSVADDFKDRPVNYVGWGDAARYANWLHNGKPSGPQGLSTTEDGSYFINGAMSTADLNAVTRKPGATWVLPTEDEWYKAAYHKADGVTGNYWTYATRDDTLPGNGNPEGDTGNTANYFDGTDYTLSEFGDDLYHRTEVGFFSLSSSGYGAFDMNGNVWEWNEALIQAGPNTNRGLRGGSWRQPGGALPASYRSSGINPINELDSLGFRVAFVPEPATGALLTVALLPLWRRR